LIGLFGKTSAWTIEIFIWPKKSELRKSIIFKILEINWLNLVVLRQIVRRYHETDILHLLTITSYFASVLITRALKGIEEPNATFVILQISSSSP